jgi:23S rRNA pseudouridine955/2504/2580 synthase
MNRAAKQVIIDKDDDGIRLDRWFQRHQADVSFTIIAKLVRTGSIKLDGKRVETSTRIAAGQQLSFPHIEAHYENTRLAPDVELSQEDIDYMQALVIYKDLDAVVINKPAGLATQGGTGTLRHVDGLLGALQYDSKGRPKLVHRLDKDTSGVLLLARSAKAAGHYAKAFASRTAKKTYWALVMGVPKIEAGTIELPLAKEPGTGGEKMHVDEKNGLKARTRYRVVEAVSDTCAWLELYPLTGRTHQLRVHMAAIGHPIVGDGKYGGRESFLTGSISRKMHLHARRLKVESLNDAWLDVQAELPAHMEESFAQLGIDVELGEIKLAALEEEQDTPPMKAKPRTEKLDKQRVVRTQRRGRKRQR